MHNGGDAGGWGKGTQTGPGLDPQGSNSFEEESGLLITQMAALDNITTIRIELTVNGVPQPAIIADATTTKDVLPRIGPNDTVSGTAYINLSDGTTRVAQLEETHPELGKALPFKVPYYYTCVDSSGGAITAGTYYSRDGIDLSVYTTSNMAGWLCTNDGTMHNGSYVSGVRGDITLTPVYNAPNCVITVTPPGTATETALGSGIYKITNISDSFSFLVGLSDGSSFPAGTNTTWQINGNSFSGTTPETCGAAPDDVGITVASIGSNATNASTMTINCLINIPGEPQAAVTKTIKVFKKIDMPTTFSIDVTAPATASADSITADKYAVTVPADTFTFAASLSGGATFPTGTVFNWTINAGGTTITKTGQSVTVAPSSGAALSTIYASPTSWTISCAIRHPDMANATAPSDTKTISLYKENPLKMTVGTPSTGTSYSGDIYKITDMSNTFSFKATEEDGSPLPAAETTFQWYVGGSLVSGANTSTFSPTPTTLGLTEATMGTNQTNATPVEVKCVVTRPSGNSVPVVKTIKVFKPVTLPTSFDVTVTAPSTAGATQPYAVYRDTDSFTFAAAPSGGGSFPTGTKFSWTITGGSTTVTKTNLSTSSVNVAASEFGTISTTSATPTTLTATCTIDHADKLNTAQSDDTTAQVYKFTIPAFTITFTPAAGSYNTANSNTSAAVPVYAMTDTTTAFTIKAVPTAGSFPAGTKFDWTVNGYTMSGGTQHSDTLSTNFASIGLSNLSTSSASPTSFSITCTAHDDHDPVLVTKNADNKTIKVYELRYTVSFDTGTGGSTVASQTVAPAGTATEPADPTRTDYTFAGWYTSTDGGTTLSATPYDFTSAVYADLTLYAKWAGAVYMDTGSTIKAALIALGADAAPNKTFSASATPPAAGTTTQKLSTADSPTEVVAWLDGTTIKYYAGGYTNTGTKIPLNANSSGMFSGCKELITIDVSGFDTGNVTKMSSMFNDCKALTSITGLNGFVTSKVTDMQCMFYGCSALASLNLSSFDTSNVTQMYRMFYGCEALTSITGLNGFVTSKVTDMECMFYSCQTLTNLDLSSFDTSNVTDMSSMFSGCYALTSLDLSSFDTRKVTNMYYMFQMDPSYGTSVLTNIKVSSNFDTTNVTSSSSMFSGCTLLVGGNGTSYDPSKTNKTYAIIDGTGGQPGYFTGP